MKDKLNIFFAFALVLSGTAIAALSAELFLRYVYYTKKDREAGIAALYAQQESIRFIEQPNAKQNCHWEDSLVAHPYMGFVYHSAPPCGRLDSNRQGFLGNLDIPNERDPNFFTVMIIGDSVAEQLAVSKNSAGENYLELTLNRDFESPNGKPFRVMNAAMGGQTRPVANISTLLYGDAADGIVSIDGFNEAHISRFHLVTFPAEIYNRLILTPSSRMFVLRFEAASFVRNIFRTAPLLRHSFFGFFIQDKTLNLFFHQFADTFFKDERSRNYFRSFKPGKGIPRSRLLALNIAKYKNFIRSNHAIASTYKTKFAHFLQPIPAFKKELTEIEKSAPMVLNKAEYLPFIEAMQELRREGEPVASLADLFNDISSSIYMDSVHCGYFENGENRGYQMISEEIAKNLSQMWKFPRKKLAKIKTARL